METQKATPTIDQFRRNTAELILKKSDDVKVPQNDVKVSSRVPTFDLSLFVTKRSTHTGYVTLEARAILSKDPEARNEKDLDLLEDELKQMVFFQRFPYAIQREIAREIRFVIHQRGQVVIRQGHRPMSMYIIVAGLVQVSRVISDPSTGEERHIQMGELSHDNSFGVDDLIYNRIRTHTVRCRMRSQFLQLHAESFHRLLNDTLQKDALLIDSSLRSNQALAGFEWDDEDLQQLREFTTLGRYPTNTIIYNESEDNSYCVHFIVHGQCALEQVVEFVIEHNFGYNRFKPVPSGSTSSKTIKKRLQVGVLVTGHYFGFGEKISVRALELVETIRIPKEILLKRKSKKCDQLLDHLQGNLPTLQDVLDEYLGMVKWQTFSKKVTKQVLAE